MKAKPKIVGEKVVYTNRWITVYKKDVRVGDQLLDCYVVGKKQKLAAILALDAQQNVILTKQYRWAVDDSPLDIPGGSVLPGEQPSEAARRELLEETGYRAGAIELLTCRYLDSGQKDCVQYIFVATGLTPGSGRLDATEDIQVVTKNLYALRAEILAGKRQESSVMIAVLMYAAKENK